jgi:hypothetical protein
MELREVRLLLSQLIQSLTADHPIDPSALQKLAELNLSHSIPASPASSKQDRSEKKPAKEVRFQ